jgi:hypothetical protein
MAFGDDPPGVDPVAGHHTGMPSSMRMINRRVSALAVAAVVFMIPWMIYLGLTLPQRYDARQWELVWIGFDVFEVAVLLHVAWSAWFRRQLTLVSTIVAATLLFSDAWFDVITSIGNRDEWITLATALLGEIPLALFFMWVARRILLRMVAAVHVAEGGSGPPPRLRDARVLTQAIGPSAATVGGASSTEVPGPPRGDSESQSRDGEAL